MPNWCYTQVCFEGKKDDIIRLDNDIQSSLKFDKRYPGYCNLFYFYAISGIECSSYIKKNNGLAEFARNASKSGLEIIQPQAISKMCLRTFHVKKDTTVAPPRHHSQP